MSYEQTPPDELRQSYIQATLSQRYHIANQRIENAGSGPSLLVGAMAALEGFARAAAVDLATRAGRPHNESYLALRNVGPIELLRDHICPAYSLTPEEMFGGPTWNSLSEAVNFRNLLVHEATYLHGGTCTRLAEVARTILDQMATRSGAV